MPGSSRRHARACMLAGWMRRDARHAAALATGPRYTLKIVEPQDQQHQEDHDEDVEQEAGDIGAKRPRCR